VDDIPSILKIEFDSLECRTSIRRIANVPQQAAFLV
jgi:hypothetical protein